ncbi:hypothetical protein EGW08_019507 [Elysia chlorotica]|uniref:ZSWIM1/3 RNaseH-like domain-containing protein n=1 Tax=Elysia chlorotica TaxID=188477 RepID=A0A433STY1_ELYCH|nr:hypothetical protein EGW08_019507 [Elysia chlorotica]
MVEDSNGKGRAVFFAFVRCENVTTLSKMVAIFKEFVGSTEATAIYITDKSPEEIEACRHGFPNAVSLLCHFHVHKAMRTKLAKLRCSPESKNAVRSLAYRLVTTTCSLGFNLRCENVTTLSKMVAIFKEFVGSTEATSIYMTDKSPEEIEACRHGFPNAVSLLCHFHVHKAMRTKLAKLRCSPESKNAVRSLAYRLVTTTCSLGFNQDLEKNNWLCDQYSASWPTHRRLHLQTFGNDTNNKCEAEHQRMQAGLNASCNLAAAVQWLYEHSIMHEGELAQALYDAQMTRVQLPPGSLTGLKCIYDQYVSHAVKMMLDNHSQLSELTMETDSEQQVVVKQKNVCFKVKFAHSKVRCHCLFSIQMNLPCVHMCFMVLEKGFSLDSLVKDDCRWLRGQVRPTDPQRPTSSTSGALVVRVLEPERRHHKTENLLLEISRFLKLSGSREFEDRSFFLQQTLRLWESGKRALCLEEVAEEDVRESAVVHVPVSTVESSVVDVPVSTVESSVVHVPVSTVESSVVDVPVSTVESSVVDVPVSTVESAVVDVPVSLVDPAVVDVPVSTVDPAVVDVPISLRFCEM